MKQNYCKTFFTSTRNLIICSLMVHCAWMQAYTPQTITLTHNYLTIDPRNILANLTIAQYQKDHHTTQFIFQGKASLMQSGYALHPQIDSVSMGVGYRKLFFSNILGGIYNFFDVRSANFVIINPGVEIYLYGFHLNLNAYASLGALIEDLKAPSHPEKVFSMAPKVHLTPGEGSRIEQHYYLGESEFNWDCKLSYTFSKGIKPSGGIYFYQDYYYNLQSVLGYMGRLEYSFNSSWNGYIQSTYDASRKFLFTIGATWAPVTRSASQNQNLLLKLPIDRHLISPYIIFSQTEQGTIESLKRVYELQKPHYGRIKHSIQIEPKTFSDLTKAKKKKDIQHIKVLQDRLDQLIEYRLTANAYLGRSLNETMNLPTTLSKQEINREFKQAQRKAHPDKHPSNRREEATDQSSKLNQLRDLFTVTRESDSKMAYLHLLSQFNTWAKQYDLDPL